MAGQNVGLSPRSAFPSSYHLRALFSETRQICGEMRGNAVSTSAMVRGFVGCFVELVRDFLPPEIRRDLTGLLPTIYRYYKCFGFGIAFQISVLGYGVIPYSLVC
jgi:hypothetical protein